MDGLDADDFSRDKGGVAANLCAASLFDANLYAVSDPYSLVGADAAEALNPTTKIAPSDRKVHLLESRVRVGRPDEPEPTYTPRGVHRVYAQGPRRSIWSPRTYAAALQSIWWAMSAIVLVISACVPFLLLAAWINGTETTEALMPALGINLSAPVLASVIACRQDWEVLKDACYPRIPLQFDRADAALWATSALKYDNDAALQALLVLEKGTSTSLEARQLAADNLLRLRDKQLEREAEQEEIEAAKAAAIEQLDEETNLYKGLPDEIDMRTLQARLDFNDN